MGLEIVALVVAVLSFATSLWALRYARVSARAADDVARVEQERLVRERHVRNSAVLVMVEALDRDVVQISNDGQHTASDIRLAYPGLRFRTLMEDDEAGLSLAPGETLELMPLIDWDHPHNQRMRGREKEGRMGVPSFPLHLSWTDATGRHDERRRVRPRTQLE